MARTGPRDRSGVPCALIALAWFAIALLPAMAGAQTYPDPLVNTATVTAPGDTFDPAAGNNTGTDTNTLAAVSQLSVVKTLLTASPARVGAIVGYQIIVGNAGPSTAVNVLVSDPVPPQLTGVTWTCTASAPTSSCASPSGAGDISTTVTIAAGDTITFLINGIAPTLTPATIAANTVTLTLPPGTTDPTPGDDTSTVPPVPVIPNPIVANDDTGASVPGAAGGIAVGNVRGNDTLDAITATAVTTALTVTTPPASANITLDPATGAVTVAPATPAGNYSLTYQLCEIANPGNCDTAVVTIPVSAAAINAVDDVAGPIPGAGGTNVVNVLANDTLGAAPVVPAAVVLTPANSGPITINPDGSVDIAPNTPAGTYTATYQICEALNPANCDGATVTITVAAAVIDAVDDVAGPIPGTGGTNVVNVLTNDTSNAAPVLPATVVLTPANSGPITINPDGSVDVAPNTPAGTYTATYQICEVLNPANCDGATVTITVVAAAIDAVDDVGPAPVNGSTGGTAVASVLANDSLAGAPPTSATVTLSVTVPPASANITIDLVSGAVIVAPNTPAGAYSLTYRICETLNPANCDTAVVTLAVSAAAIAANDDDASGTPIAIATGGTAVANVLANDLLGGAAPTLATVTLTQTAAPSNPGVVLNLATGAVTVAAGTPSGTYTLTYQICEQLNPANCDTAVVTVVVAPSVLDAVADVAGPINGLPGAVAVVNVLTNDTFNAAPATLAQVSLAPVTAGPLTINANGTVDVAPNTPAGSYVANYQICDLLAPANCDGASVTVTVVAATIDAVNDDFSATPVNGSAGGTTASLLLNDTLNGLPFAPAAVLLTTGALPAGITINPNGTVTIAPNTPAATVVITYQICEVLNPANCDSATATITVAAAIIDAVDDLAPGPVPGVAGGQAIANVLVNDTLDALPIALSAAILSQVSTTQPGVSLDPATGAVNVAPNTPAGTFSLVYRLCSTLNPASCDQATATVTVSAALIDAVVDDFSATPVSGVTGGTTASLLLNDTLNGAPATPATVTLIPGPTPPGVTVNPNGTVTIAANTPAATVVITYQICEILNPANCDGATATIVIAPGVIDAVNDDFSATPVNGSTGGTTPSLLANDTLNGAPVTPATIVLTSGPLPPGLSLNPDGTVSIAPNTAATTVVITYQICEVLNPANCDGATATIVIAPGVIDAVDDNFSATPVNGSTGGTTPSLLVNDTLNGAPVVPAAIVLTSTSLPPGFVLNAAGTVTVPANTAAGNYSVGYRICEALNPTNCDTATATITVAPGVIDAVDDNFSGTPIPGASGGTTASVLGNDTLNAATVAPAAITLTATTVPPGLTLNADGTVTVAAATPAGSYVVGYRICENLNPTNCDTAAATVAVAAAQIDAVNDNGVPVNGATGGTAVPNVLVNDTVAAAAATLAAVNLTQTSSTSPQVTLNLATGAVVVAPNTPAGTYQLVYQICEKLNPTNCDRATVTVTVALPPIDAVDDNVGPVNGAAGGTAVANVLGNDSFNGAAINLATIVLTPVSNGPLSVRADGSLDVAPGTPAGSYSVAYQICDQINPTNCDTATVTVLVAAATIVATNDTGTTAQNTPVTTIVWTNDLMNGQPMMPGQIVVTVSTPPTRGTAVVNGNGSVTYTPTPNTSGVDTYSYTVCELINPANCATATVTITVLPNAVSANDDAAQTRLVTPVVVAVLTNDSTTGAALNPATLAIQAAPANGSATCSASACTYTANAGFTGTDTFSYQVCDVSQPTPVCDTATVTVVVVADDVSLRLTKRAAQSTARIGDLVRYIVDVENVGNIAAVNVSVIDTLPAGFTYVNGSLVVVDDNQGGSLGSINPLRIDGIDLAVGARGTVTYTLRVGAGVGLGTHTNRVVGLDDEGHTLSNLATADIEIVGDPLLDDSLIVGTVFDDHNGNGRQDDGERGIPGVRVDSVEGLVIETDSYGRFHLVGIDGGSARGRNFILKVDPATLPAGAVFTTGNPRIRRITPGLPVRFDFGVKVPATALNHGEAAVDVELGEVLFAGASAVVRDEYSPMFDRIAATLREHGGGRVRIAARADAEALAFERARAVQQALMSRLHAGLAAKVQVDVVGAVDPTERLLSLDHAIGLTGVLFDTNKATIRPQFRPLISEIAKAVETQGYGQLNIVGHADSRGSAEHNRALGLRRAKAVFDAIAAELSPAVRKRLSVDVVPANPVVASPGATP